MTAVCVVVLALLPLTNLWLTLVASDWGKGAVVKAALTCSGLYFALVAVAILGLSLRAAMDKASLDTLVRSTDSVLGFGSALGTRTARYFVERTSISSFRLAFAVPQHITANNEGLVFHLPIGFSKHVQTASLPFTGVKSIAFNRSQLGRSIVKVVTMGDDTLLIPIGWSLPRRLSTIRDARLVARLRYLHRERSEVGSSE